MAWKLKLDRLVGGLWRLAIILLPWQTRYFFEGPTVNGWPWEQGRLSLYTSWLVMASVVAVTYHATRNTQHKSIKAYFGLILLLVSSLFTLSPRATLEFWIEAALLASFVAALVRLRVTREQLATWFVISLIPHLALGFWQWTSQMVTGSKWLGMSAQNPLTSGVSVIEVAGQRILRVYGGFPHPNIFGGWLALAIPLAVWLISRGRSVFLSSVFCLLSSSILVLTFARGAWIACALGLVAVLFFWYRENHSEFPRKLGKVDRRMWVILGLMLLSVGITAFQTRDMMFIRLQSTARLEVKSLDERSQGLANGWRLFVEHPVFGVGPGAAIYGLSAETPYESTPPIPPHLVPLLILDEVGIVGIIGLTLVGYWLFKKRSSPIMVMPLTVIVTLSLFDHYPWSLWSGRALAILAITFCILSSEILKPAELAG